MKVPLDFVCEHGLQQPWATCVDCMLLPRDEQPVPIQPESEPPPPAKKRAPRTASGTGSGSSTPRNRKARTAKAPRPSTRLPRSMADEAPTLFGDSDLAYEIPEDNAYFHMMEPDNDWVAISSMPKRLRPDGWLYLQVDRDVIARCRVRGIGFRDRRWTQEPKDDTADLGPGPTLELRSSTWERYRRDLGPDGDAPVSGYRYLVTDAEGRVRVADES